MTITKYTFFSPAGNNFPVTANSDAKLYMMLGDLPYNTFVRKDFKPTTQAGLTKTYVNTSIVAAGRYFELTNHLISLIPSSKNYIHVAIDLSTPLDPVSIVIGTSDQSNTLDLNNDSGVYKRCIEIVETSGGQILKTTVIPSTKIIEDLKATNAEASNTKTVDLTVTDEAKFQNGATVTGKTSTTDLQVYGSTVVRDIIATTNITASGETAARSLKSTTSTKTKSLEITGDLSQRSNTFKSPTIYSTINGTAIQEFVLYRNGNTVTGTFADSVLSGSIPSGGAIIGWVQDNAFKPQYTQKFSWRTKNGKNFMLSVDPGGAFRSWGDALSVGDEIYGGVFWICKGTEGGL